MNTKMKIAAVFAAALMLLSFSACAVNMPDSSSSSNTSSEAEATPEPEASVDESKFADNLEGLQEYMVAKEYISGTPVDMEASFIGAKDGVKYTCSYEGSNNITMELYEYDTSSLNETAQEVINSVKENGTFELMDITAEAVLSDSGKYLMVYKDSASGEVHDTRTKQVKEDFTAFKK